MPQAASSHLHTQSGQRGSDTAVPGLLAKLVYRSRAVQPLSPQELQQLALDAQARNRTESITGLVLYDDSRFFQWLEGPAESLDRIMQSIRNDPRHTDIEVLENDAAQERRFSEWNMQLAVPRPGDAPRRPGVIDPPSEVIEGLRKHPDAAPALLVKLMPISFGVAANDPGTAAMAAQVRLKTDAILQGVFRAKVIPLIVDANRVVRAQPVDALANPRVREFADLLLAVDGGPSNDLIREVCGEAGLILPLYATLFEPAARRLADLWSEDLCSEVEVTLGLCRIQMAARLIGAQTAPTSLASAATAAQAPLVLIAPEPGEVHGLGAALDAEVMWDAGWAPRCAFPADDRALQDLVAGSWFDVLDLSLSSAFQREDSLTRMAHTIALARSASRNPELVVVVGGRVFFEQETAGRRVGADAASKTARHVDDVILRAMDEATGENAMSSAGGRSKAAG